MKNSLKLFLSAGLLILATSAFAQTDTMPRRPKNPPLDDTLRPKEPRDTSRKIAPDKKYKNQEDKSNTETPKNPTVGIKEEN